MYYTATDARYVRDFTIWARFADGSEGEIDLADELWGPVFEPLKNVTYFRNFSVAEYGTICWPNGRHRAGVSLREGARSRLTTIRGDHFGPHRKGSLMPLRTRMRRLQRVSTA